MHWFRDLSPGTGVTLANGSTYTLARVGKKDGVPALGVVREVDDEEEALTVQANVVTPDAPVLFEAWDLYPVKIFLHSRSEGFAKARVVRGDERRTINAHEGDIVYRDNNMEVRLEQVLAHALAVDDRGDPMYARTVTFMDKMITLREGEVRSVGPFRVRYRVTPLPPDQRSVLSLVDNDGHVREQHVLGPEQVWTTGTWRFAQAEDAPVSDSFIVLEVSRHQGGPARELGMVLFLVGALGWGVARGRAVSGR